MADAMWRLTGKPQVIIGNQGPGVANLMPAAICASKEKAPVIFIGGQRGRELDSQVRRSKFQYTPQSRYYEAAVKYVGVIEFASQVDEVFHEAFRQALSGTPGPVYIEYPNDHCNTDVDLGPVAAPATYRLTHQQADPDAVSRAAALLSEAQCPLVLVGCGVRNARAFDALDALLDQLKCPVIPTWAARGVVPDTDPRVLLYSAPAANDAIAAADVVLALGTSIGENLHYGVGRHWANGNTDRKWIYVERDAGNIGVNRPIDVPLVGDVRHARSFPISQAGERHTRPRAMRSGIRPPRFSRYTRGTWFGRSLPSFLTTPLWCAMAGARRSTNCTTTRCAHAINSALCTSVIWAPACLTRWARSLRWAATDGCA